MESKVKLIVFALVGLFLVSVGVAYVNYTGKEEITREKEKLDKANVMLETKIGKLEGIQRENDNKISQLNLELDKASRAKKDLETRYETSKKNEEQLVREIKELREQKTAVRMEAAVPKMQAMPVQPRPSDDEYWAGLIRDNKDMGMQLDKLRVELRTAQTQGEQLQREKGILELDITNLKTSNEDLKRQLEYNQKISDAIAKELVREKNDKSRIEASLKTITNENLALARQLKSLNGQKTELEKKISQLQEDKTGLDSRLSEAETKLTERVSKISQLKEQLEGLIIQKEPGTYASQKDSVELSPIVVRAQNQAAAASLPESVKVVTTGSMCKVLAINRDNNFVIVDAGEASGVKIGDTFSVYRDGEKIGSVEAIQTRKNISACDIKKETKIIAIGDVVK